MLVAVHAETFNVAFNDIGMDARRVVCCCLLEVAICIVNCFSWDERTCFLYLK